MAESSAMSRVVIAEAAPPPRAPAAPRAAFCSARRPRMREPTGSGPRRGSGRAPVDKRSPRRPLAHGPPMRSLDLVCGELQPRPGVGLFILPPEQPLVRLLSGRPLGIRALDNLAV